MLAPSLSAPYTLELVTYNLNDDADAETFVALNREVGETSISIQPWFRHREIGKNDDGTWSIAVFWNMSEDARNSIANIDSIPDVVKSYMAMINRETLKRDIFEIV